MEEYDYLQNLPDSVLTLIFARLINSDQYSSLADIKFLCQCSLVSKQFNRCIPLLFTLSITHPCLGELHDNCPKILKKFKYIQMLYLKHGSPPNLHNFKWKATCAVSNRGNSIIYGMTSLSYSSVEKCLSTDQNKLFTCRVLAAPCQTALLCVSTENYVSNMLQLHDRLLMCIQRLQLLYHVEITDSRNHGSLILDGYPLEVLRYSPYNSVKGKRHKKRCFVGELPLNGLLMKGVTMNIVQKWKDHADAADVTFDNNIPKFTNLEAGETVFCNAFESILNQHRGLVQIGYSRLLAGNGFYEILSPKSISVASESKEPLNFGMGVKDRFSPYVSRLLLVSVPRKRMRRDDNIKKLYSTDPSIQLDGTTSLALLLEQDIRLGDLRSKDVRTLIEFLKHPDNPELQFYAAFALTHVDSNGGEVIKSEAIPLLVDLMISKHTNIRLRGLITLMRIVYDFPESIRDLHEIGALQLLEDVVISNGWKDYRMLINCATFLAIVCRGKFYLPACEKRVALRIIKLLLRYGCANAKRQALIALSYLSNGSYVSFEGNICKFVLGFITHDDPLIVISALQVVGNIITWGNNHQTQFMLRKGLLRHLYRLLHHEYKIVRYEVCRIIQSMEIQKERREKTLPYGNFKIHEKEGTNLCIVIEKNTGERINLAECADNFLQSLSEVHSKSLEMSSNMPLPPVNKEMHTFSELKWMGEVWTPKQY